jgi:hypothetical protein
MLKRSVGRAKKVGCPCHPRLFLWRVACRPSKWYSARLFITVKPLIKVLMICFHPRSFACNDLMLRSSVLLWCFDLGFIFIFCLCLPFAHSRIFYQSITWLAVPSLGLIIWLSVYPNLRTQDRKRWHFSSMAHRDGHNKSDSSFII